MLCQDDGVELGNIHSAWAVSACFLLVTHWQVWRPCRRLWVPQVPQSTASPASARALWQFAVLSRTFRGIDRVSDRPFWPFHEHIHNTAGLIPEYESTSVWEFDLLRNRDRVAETLTAEAQPRVSPPLPKIDRQHWFLQRTNFTHAIMVKLQLLLQLLRQAGGRSAWTKDRTARLLPLHLQSGNNCSHRQRVAKEPQRLFTLDAAFTSTLAGPRITKPDAFAWDNSIPGLASSQMNNTCLPDRYHMSASNLCAGSLSQTLLVQQSIFCSGCFEWAGPRPCSARAATPCLPGVRV